MFKTHATIWPVLSGRVAPRQPAAFINNGPSNDNRPGFRRLADQCRRAKPSLICRWIELDDHLECRWDLVTGREALQHHYSEKSHLTGSSFEPPLLARGCGAHFARTV